MRVSAFCLTVGLRRGENGHVVITAQVPYMEAESAEEATEKGHSFARAYFSTEPLLKTGEYTTYSRVDGKGKTKEKGAWAKMLAAKVSG